MMKRRIQMRARLLAGVLALDGLIFTSAGERTRPECWCRRPAGTDFRGMWHTGLRMLTGGRVL
ncbi:MAG: hypothetical protein M3463_14880 [Verrucomicrobiota bacterium]|nr:hypothetical protein [Verrucomicrobiota bacterium]